MSGVEGLGAGGGGRESKGGREGAISMTIIYGEVAGGIHYTTRSPPWRPDKNIAPVG